MLSIQYIRDNKEKVINAAKNKNRVVDVERVIELDNNRIELVKQIQKLREERNTQPKGKPTIEQIERGKTIKEELKDLEQRLTLIESELYAVMLQIPNVPLDEVPVGKDETGNVELRTWGTIPSFTFTPKGHIELGKELDLLDIDKGAAISGFRGYFLKNELAVLHMGLLMYVYTKLISKGYTPIVAPSIVKSFTLEGNGQFPWGKQDVYALNDEDSYLSGTAEVPVTAYNADSILEESALPKKYVAVSPCFRREIGSYGKDTKGLYRVHEFWKIEQVIVTTNDLDRSLTFHEELQKNSEEILQDLELPFRVLLMCTGDMGEPQMKKYDTEVWMPSRNGYGETMSNSIMGDFQARRLKIKYRKKDGTTAYCYTLNNTAVASPRILIALLENHQQEDGTVKIPQALQTFVGFDTIHKKK